MNALYVDNNKKGDFDIILHTIADYVLAEHTFSSLAYKTAHLCLLDALGCGILALEFPECVKLLGPIVPHALLPCGARVPGTNFELDPVQAAFNIGILVRWLDFNDTWLAAEWGHPSDNLGAILAVADYIDRGNMRNISSLTMHDVLTAMIKAYEIQGVLALNNSFNRLGFDHVFLVKLASTALSVHLFKLNKISVLSALSQVFVDGASLRTYRHAPNTGYRKSWAAGDASARGVRLALLTLLGEEGYPSALSVPKWGFNEILLKNNELILPRPLESYVIENILFKVGYPAEFHAQTAVECALILHEKVKTCFNTIASIEITTQEPAIRIISKKGPLYNAADRDHCLQYIIAATLLHGNLEAKHYEDEYAQDVRIDILREKMVVVENKQFSLDYLDITKRSIGNSLQLIYTDGSKSPLISIEYPLGHRSRREEALPYLMKKFQKNVAKRFFGAKLDKIMTLAHLDEISSMRVKDFISLWT